MEKVYKAKIGWPFWLSVAIVCLAISALFYFTGRNQLTPPLSLLAFIVPVVMLVWVYFTTKYVIKNDTLSYQSGFIKGDIFIPQIQSVKTNTTLWMGTKPSLASKGLIIKYSRYRQVFISPAEPDTFLSDLKKINPSIEIV